MTRSDSERADDETVDRDAVGSDGEPEHTTGHDGVDRNGRAADSADRITVESVPETLDRLRTHPRDRWLALAVAAIVGLALAWLHWLGLLLGGALVGLVSRSVGRALLAGIGFGALVLAVFAVTLGGSLGTAAAMTPASYLTVAAALGLPAFGSLVRGVA